MRYQDAEGELRLNPRVWLVTGAAGFIGANLVVRLLELGQKVRGLDNFSTGTRANISELEELARANGEFSFFEGDIRDAALLTRATCGVDFVLHQAALGSVPRSLEDPLTTNDVNVSGSLTVFSAARTAGVERLVYASSSSVYGDTDVYPMREDSLGRALSPYAVSKRSVELYAQTWIDRFGQDLVGLRYFNVFGPRQNIQGPYCAVVPLWISELLAGRQCRVFGDGAITRDFSYVENVVRANILAALGPRLSGVSPLFNVGCGQELSLLDIHRLLVAGLSRYGKPLAENLTKVCFAAPRAGDLQRSRADIGRAIKHLGYEPAILAEEGIARTVEWFVRRESGS